jgi:hypothetical protein
MNTLEDEKGSVRHVEGGAIHSFDGVKDHNSLEVVLPASLQGMDAAQLAEIERSGTRKLDILLMPTLVSLYILSVIRLRCVWVPPD